MTYYNQIMITLTHSKITTFNNKPKSFSSQPVMPKSGFGTRDSQRMPSQTCFLILTCFLNWIGSRWIEASSYSTSKTILGFMPERGMAYIWSLENTMDSVTKNARLLLLHSRSDLTCLKIQILKRKANRMIGRSQLVSVSFLEISIFQSSLLLLNRSFKSESTT